MQYTEFSPNTRKESMHTWRRRNKTHGALGNKSVYISVNYNTNFKSSWYLNPKRSVSIFSLCCGSGTSLLKYCRSLRIQIRSPGTKLTVWTTVYDIILLYLFLIFVEDQIRYHSHSYALHPPKGYKNNQ
jgi:hypothetical protein